MKTQEIKTCPLCGEQDFIEDSTKGIKSCLKCGHIVSTNNLEQKLEFDSAQHAHGKFILADGHKHALNENGSASKEFRLNKAQDQVQHIGYKLSLPKYLIDAGKRYYKMAFEKNFVQGRTVNQVAAVCLYAVCRQDKAPYLLIDFADAVQINMFTLGQVYMQLVQKLYLQIPLIDPCLYIRRFCDRLCFGDKMEQVARLATRFMQSMNRAWISTGRRPNGLCGSAVLIAARVMGYKRSTSQVVKVAHVCEETIRKRMSEFKMTNMAQLTCEKLKEIEYNNGNGENGLQGIVEENMDPPSFTRKMLMIEMRQATGQELTEADQERFHKVLKDRADKIQGKLTNGDDEIKNPIEPNKEDDLVVEDEARQMALVPVAQPSSQELVDPQQSLENLIASLPDESDEDYQIALQNLPEISNEIIDKMIMSEKEAEIKAKYWATMNQDWIKEQNEKKRAKKIANRQKRLARQSQGGQVSMTVSEIQIQSQHSIMSDPQSDSPKSKQHNNEDFSASAEKSQKSIIGKRLNIEQMDEESFGQQKISVKRQKVKAEMAMDAAEAVKRRMPDKMHQDIDTLFDKNHEQF